MTLNETEQRFIIYIALTLIGIVSFIMGLVANAIIKMGKDITDIKIAVTEVATKHDDTEKRVCKLEDKIFK